MRQGIGVFLMQAKDGILVGHVTGVQTCDLPISPLVERFEVQDEFINERGEVVLKARVDVSESTIVNYVAAQHAQTSHVDGASLMAEIQRNTNHREALKAMFRRFFRGYPSEVVALELAEMVPRSEEHMSEL